MHRRTRRLPAVPFQAPVLPLPATQKRYPESTTETRGRSGPEDAERNRRFGDRHLSARGVGRNQPHGHELRLTLPPRIHRCSAEYGRVCHIQRHGGRFDHGLRYGSRYGLLARHHDCVQRRPRCLISRPSVERLDRARECSRASLHVLCPCCTCLRVGRIQYDRDWARRASGCHGRAAEAEKRHC